MKVIAYAYDADIHCIACAKAAWAARDLRYPRRLTHISLHRDEHSLPYGVIDREGNEVDAVFSTSDDPHITCGDCADVVRDERGVLASA